MEDPATAISELGLLRFTTDLGIAAGADPADARDVADALVWADLHGRPAQGVARLPSFLERLRRGGVRSPASMRWERVAPAAWRLDAGDAFGPVAARAAALRATALAAETGIGVCVVRRSHLFGAAARYGALVAERGAIGLVVSNAAPKVAPHGGIRAALGTNPLAFACPAPGAPILIDLATSALAGSTLRDHARRGDVLPGDVALDAAGNPTRDAHDAERGCLLPAAGAKGFALALMVEVLAGALAGAALGAGVGSIFDASRPSDTGHFILAIDLERFGGRGAFVERLAPLLREIRAAGREPGAVRLPGEVRAALAERHRLRGIPLEAATRRSLERLAANLAVTAPWQGATASPETSPCP